METTLHRQLKQIHCAAGGPVEVRDGPYRADAIGPDGAWVEVQSGALGPLRDKLRALLPERAVRIIKPVVLEKRITWQARRDGPVRSSRRSPRRGTFADFFEDFMGLARLYPHPNLSIDVLGASIEEVRVPRRRRPGYAVVDRRLVAVRDTVRLICAGDLWRLLPDDVPDPFSTHDLAGVLGSRRCVAQRVAYGLRLAGAAVPCGKRGNAVLYQRPGPHGPDDFGRAIAPSDPLVTAR